MVKVYLVNGTNHGRTLTVQHGNSVRLPRRMPMPHPTSYSGPTTTTYFTETELYARPSGGVTIINGAERWLLVKEPKS